MFVYLMRYLHQPYSELRRLPLQELLELLEETGKLVQRENGDTVAGDD